MHFNTTPAHVNGVAIYFIIQLYLAERAIACSPSKKDEIAIVDRPDTKSILNTACPSLLN